MIQILDSNKKRNMTQQLLAGLKSAMPGIQSFLDKNEAMKRENSQRQAASNLGLDPDLSPELQKMMMQYQLMGGLEDKKGQNQLNLLSQQQQFKKDEAAKKLQGERKEKLAPFQNALDSINEMKSIGQKGNLGWGSGIKRYFDGETAKDYGKYEQLGKSLISFASTIPISNKSEFDTLAHKLYDPGIQDAQREGILDALADIIKRNMNMYSEQNQEEGFSSLNTKNKPPLQSFER